MVKIKVKDGECITNLDGNITSVLAEISIGLEQVTKQLSKLTDVPQEKNSSRPHGGYTFRYEKLTFRKLEYNIINEGG